MAVNYRETPAGQLQAIDGIRLSDEEADAVDGLELARRASKNRNTTTSP